MAAPPWSALMLLIPLVNVGFIWWLAFAKAAERKGTHAQRGSFHQVRHDGADTVTSTSPA